MRAAENPFQHVSPHSRAPHKSLSSPGAAPGAPSPPPPAHPGHPPCTWEKVCSSLMMLVTLAFVVTSLVPTWK